MGNQAVVSVLSDACGYIEDVPDHVERALVEEVKRLGYRVSETKAKP